MLQKRSIHIAYTIALVIVIGAILFRFMQGADEHFAETMGDVLKYLFFVEYAFIFIMIVVRSKVVNIKMINKNMKYLVSIHRCIGIACIAFLGLHVAFIFEVQEMWKTHYLEGYAILILIGLAILSLKNKKVLKGNSLNFHMALALISIVPFLLHI